MLLKYNSSVRNIPSRDKPEQFDQLPDDLVLLLLALRKSNPTENDKCIKALNNMLLAPRKVPVKAVEQTLDTTEKAVNLVSETVVENSLNETVESKTAASSPDSHSASPESHRSQTKQPDSSPLFSDHGSNTTTDSSSSLSFSSPVSSEFPVCVSSQKVPFYGDSYRIQVGVCLRSVLRVIMGGPISADGVFCLKLQAAETAKLPNSLQLLEFLLNACRDQEATVDSVVNRLLNSQHLRNILCSFCVAFKDTDFNSVGANGYCYPRAITLTKIRELSNYTMTVNDLTVCDLLLFKSNKTTTDKVTSEVKANFIVVLKEIVEAAVCPFDSELDKSFRKRATGALNSYICSDTQSLDYEFWGHMGITSNLKHNVTGFDATNLFIDELPACPVGYNKWAKLCYSSVIRQSQEEKLREGNFWHTLHEVHELLQKPPNFFAWSVNHFFLISSPSQFEARQSSHCILCCNYKFNGGWR